MANRGPNVNYTLPSINANIKTSCSPLEQICSIMLTNSSEFVGVNNVWNNPDRAGNNQPKDIRLPGPNSSFATTVNTLNASFNVGNDVTINRINTLIDSTTSLEQSFSTLWPNNHYVTATKGSNGIDISANLYQAIVSNLQIISSNLDSVNNWWDSSDVCALSCQVACQQACQLACQSCYGGTCHNQNCGGWS